MEKQFEYKEPEESWRGNSMDGFEKTYPNGEETKCNRLVLEHIDEACDRKQLLLTHENFSKMLRTMDNLRKKMADMEAETALLRGELKAFKTNFTRHV